MLCSNCTFQLRLSYTFKEQCQRSEIQLREVFSPQEMGEIDKLILKTVTEDKIDLSPNNIASEVTVDENNDDKNNVVVDKYENFDETDGNNDAMEQMDELDEDCDYLKLENPTRFQCKECQRVFKFEGSCKLHVLRHKEFKKCDVCEQEFKCKSFLFNLNVFVIKFSFFP